jgi:ABC-type multidrug transport system fused ATPase/permease subunit
MTGSLTETALGARTVEALNLQERRVARGDADIAASYAAERYTLYLRCWWFPTVDASFVLPVVAVLALGGWLAINGHATLGQVTAVTLYVQQLLDPLDRLLDWLDELQVGASSMARLVGVTEVPDDRAPTDREPVDEQLQAEDVRFAYLPGRDVLHGLDLAVRPGERLAVVGPSGAGKSTISRLLAGIHGPRTGRVELGGVPLLELPLQRLRREVALVTQEHHIFVGTIADNLRLGSSAADEEQLAKALAAVDALDWVRALPAGLDTRVGSGGHGLTPAQAQQVALARLVLADPHTLVLDEATALLDPRAARHLERSLAAVLEDRTVVAVAHRLHTAYDADRVAVVEAGRVSELGSHDELLEAGGSYAALWKSWQTDGSDGDD